MKTKPFIQFAQSRFAVAASAVIAGLAVLATTPLRGADAAPAPGATASATNAPQFAAYTGIPEILKLVDAGVSPDIIKAFIQSSSRVYPLSAADIVALKQRGVSEDIITALIRHNGDLEAKSAQFAQSQPSAPSAPTAPAPQSGQLYAPAPVPDATPVYPSDSYSYAYPNYAPFYPPYEDGYYGAYGYPWPYFYGPSIIIGGGFYRRPFFGDHDFRGGRGFHGGGNFGFHGGGGRPPSGGGGHVGGGGRSGR